MYKIWRKVITIILVAVIGVFIYRHYAHKNISDIVSSVIDIDKSDILPIYSGDNYEIVLTSKSDHTEFLFFVVKKGKVERIIKYPQENNEKNLLQWDYILNIGENTSASINFLVGKINARDFKSIEVSNVDSDEMSIVSYKENTFFYALKSIPLPIQIKLKNNNGDVIYSNK